MTSSSASNSTSSSCSYGFFGTCIADVRFEFSMMHPTLMLEPTSQIDRGTITLLEERAPKNCFNRSYSSEILAIVFKSIPFYLTLDPMKLRLEWKQLEPREDMEEEEV
ncbi:hypothetical protein V6N13_074564 [Hibiscus sabdariffa]|uniref:Uncharacterized protein n=1 Tax=Hibiscus sabdariffa TaxID=183260 RepID=A0ABR2U8U6_9ROSI